MTKRTIDYKNLTADACLKLAESGDASAQCDMARRYLHGERGVKSDWTRANALYLSAANGGNADAMLYMGMRCFRGTRDEFDESRGNEWFEKALAANDDLRATIAETYFCIGSDFYDGDYTFEEWNGEDCEYYTLDEDREKGLKYMDRAIELGYTDGAYMLGYSYYFDIGDYAKAFELFVKSDFIRSWAIVGSMYTCGQGTSVDFEKAITYFEKCVRYDAGYAFDERALTAASADGRTAGYCYYCVGKTFGDDIMAYDVRDEKKAEKYYKLAKEHGYDRALVPSGDADYYD